MKHEEVTLLARAIGPQLTHFSLSNPSQEIMDAFLDHLDPHKLEYFYASFGRMRSSESLLKFFERKFPKLRHLAVSANLYGHLPVLSALVKSGATTGNLQFLGIDDIEQHHFALKQLVAANQPHFKSLAVFNWDRLCSSRLLNKNYLSKHDWRSQQRHLVENFNLGLEFLRVAQTGGTSLLFNFLPGYRTTKTPFALMDFAGLYSLIWSRARMELAPNQACWELREMIRMAIPISKSEEREWIKEQLDFLHRLIQASPLLSAHERSTLSHTISACAILSSGGSEFVFNPQLK